ncbi:hypothetical protein SprV_0401627900 [Sparganum proliferum]
MHAKQSEEPERRTTLVVQELAVHKVDIVDLSEGFFSEQGQLEEEGADYTFFYEWLLKGRATRRWLAFAIRDDIARRPPCPPQDINDRFITLCGTKFAPSSAPTFSQ